MAVAAWPAMPIRSSSCSSTNFRRLAMPEEKAANHLTRAGCDRHSEIAPHRQMSFRHAVVGFVLPVARIFEDVIGADDAGPFESRLEHGRIAGHRKFVEVLPRHAREGVEHVALALVVDDVVEESAELSFHDLSAGVGGDLHDLVHVKFGRERSTGAVQYVELTGFARIAFSVSCCSVTSWPWMKMPLVAAPSSATIGW